VKQLQAFEFELKHDWEEESSMRKFVGACRFVFNKALAIQIENYEASNKYASAHKLEVKALKKGLYLNFMGNEIFDAPEMSSF
jgi:transposase